jgi:porin
MMTVSSPKTSAVLLTAATLLSSSPLSLTSIFAGDSCCKSGSCEKAAAETAFGLTGDWGGFRSTLREHGVEVNANYTTEIFGNPTGGKKHGSVFDGLAKLSLDINLEKAVGLQDATFRMSGFYPHGTSGSLRNVGDASLFSNIDAYDSYRLVDLWVEQKLIDGKLSVKVGQMRIDDEFGVTDSAAFYINSTFGVPNPPATQMPLGNYPIGALGARVRFEPIENVYGLLGVYDGNPSSGDFGGNGKRHGTDWALRSSEGSLYIGEAGYQRSSGEYPFAVRLGFLHHTGTFNDVRAGVTQSHNSSTSTYYVIDQNVWQKAKDSKEGLSVFLRGTMAERSTSIMSNTTQVGVTYTGLAGSDDRLGLAFARNKFSSGQQGDPSAETITELSYQFPVTSYLKVQPDVQYIAKPGGTSTHQNALVLGIRAVLDF